jgi:hypothetical protein
MGKNFRVLPIGLIGLKKSNLRKSVAHWSHCCPLVSPTVVKPLLLTIEIKLEIKKINFYAWIRVVKFHRNSKCWYSVFSTEESVMLVVDIHVNGEPLKKIVDLEKSSMSGLDPRKPYNHQPVPTFLDIDIFYEVINNLNLVVKSSNQILGTWGSLQYRDFKIFKKFEKNETF